MSLHPLRYFVAVCAVTAVFATVPAESNGCNLFGCFGNGCNLFGCFGSQTTYRPVYAAPACMSCQPQTVQYAPQTCYRAVYQTVPVTSYRPVVTSDPCSGCPVTYMQPVTTLVQQVGYVPYTTYRPVLTAAYPTVSYSASSCGPVGCFNGDCSTTTIGSSVPTYSTPTYSAPGSSCCTPTYTPAPESAAPAPAPAAPEPSATPAPSLPSTPPAAPQDGGTQTYGKPATDAEPNAEPNDVSGPALDNGALPSDNTVPQNGAQKTNDRQQRLFDPRDRTASGRPNGQRLSTAFAAARTWSRTTTGVVAAGQAETHETSADAAGWRAAHR